MSYEIYVLHDNAMIKRSSKKTNKDQTQQTSKDNILSNSNHSYSDKNNKEFEFQINLNWYDRYKNWYRNWRYKPLKIEDEESWNDKNKKFDIPTIAYWSILWQIEDYA